MSSRAHMGCTLCRSRSVSMSLTMTTLGPTMTKALRPMTMPRAMQALAPPHRLLAQQTHRRHRRRTRCLLVSMQATCVAGAASVPRFGKVLCAHHAVNMVWCSQVDMLASIFGDSKSQEEMVQALKANNGSVEQATNSLLGL